MNLINSRLDRNRQKSTGGYVTFENKSRTKYEIPLFKGKNREGGGEIGKYRFE